jgi:aminoglycoside phosphotransferase (APT) family kinase protein
MVTMTTPPPDDDERALLADIGARHGLWPASAMPVLLARGGENTTYAVDGFIARLSADRDAVAREVALLRALAGTTTVATPVPLVHEADLGLIAYQAVPGVPLLRRSDRGRPGVATAIADVLRALRRHAPAETLPPDDYSNDEWLADAAEHFEAVRSHLGAEREAVIAGFLEQPPPPTDIRMVPQHNDLGAEHILVDATGAVTGIIDWTDAASAAPARDLGLLYRDLGPDVAFRVAASLDGPLTDVNHARIRFHARCKWLEDLRFALGDVSGRRPYLRNADRTFAHTFGNEP